MPFFKTEYFTTDLWICLLQVMYDKSNVGQHLRKYIGVHLAPWHNYKWASIMIIKIFGRDFIGPFFHRLFPNHAFDMNKMKFPAVCTLLSYMRLSYPSFPVCPGNNIVEQHVEHV